MNTTALRCPGCFRPKPQTAVCPHCQYDETQDRGPVVLPHRTILNGQYMVGKVLGTPGAFGITYLGWDVRLETEVAIKEYLPRSVAGRDTDGTTVIPHAGEATDQFRDGLKGFLEEARTLARFNHPNVVRVRTFFTENGTGYLVMDYLRGRSLAQFLKQRGGKLPARAAVNLIVPVLDGLAEVHAKGILHRDIKPLNIYLTDDGTPILLDFGAARVAMGEQSQSLSVVLTPGYAPFEQYHRRGQQGPGTDLYATAATLYRLITGETPPDAPGRMHEDDLVAPSEKVPGLPPAMDIVLMQALALDADRRYASAVDLRDALRWALSAGNEPNQSMPMNPAQQILDAPSVADQQASVSQQAPSSAVAPASMTGQPIDTPAAQDVSHSERQLSEEEKEAFAAKAAQAYMLGPDRNMPNKGGAGKWMLRLLMLGVLVGGSYAYLEYGDRFMPTLVEMQGEAGAGAFSGAEVIRPQENSVRTNKPETKASARPKGNARDLLVKAEQMLKRRDRRLAMLYLERAREIDPTLHGLDRFEKQLNRGAPRPGESWRESRTGLEFRWIPSGVFIMGSDGGAADEQPSHSVAVPGFWMARTEMTRGQYARAMGMPTPNDAELPQLGVSLDQARQVTRRLGLRMPSEAEWEYVCRMGESQEADQQAWFYDNSYGRVHPVASKKAVEFGIHDLLGNVWEWTADPYKPDSYANRSLVSPAPGWPQAGNKKSEMFTARGGAYNSLPNKLRCGGRRAVAADLQASGAGGFPIGLRLVREGS